METPAETLTDGTLELRRWRVTQQAEQAALVIGSLEHLGAWLIWATNGYTAQDSAEYLTRAEKNWADGESYDYAIFDGDELAGGCGLMKRDGGMEIGYWLSQGCTGRGLMTRTVTLLVAEAFRRGAGYVEIKHDELNVRSGAVPRRLGFTYLRKEPGPETEAPAGAPADAPVATRAPATSGVYCVWRIEP